MSKVNVGCGNKAIAGWKNYDNSMSVLLAKVPFVAWILRKMGILEEGNIKLIESVIKNGVLYANASKRIPEPNHSADALYCSHVLEHFDVEEAKLFLKEALRVLKHGGVLRISVPDLKKIVDDYVATGDADALVQETALAQSPPRKFLKRIEFLLVGYRRHRWMYDGQSLCKLLSSMGFISPTVIDKGMTHIQDAGGIDLFERASKSVYVEATAP